jgi:predicted ATPase/DNA-binding winged helix-turn-helix (wHTH) protein
MAMDTPSEAPRVIEFRRFVVLLHRRELVAAGRAVKLGGRAFDILLALIEAHGTVVSRETLMERVWSGHFVEENSVQRQLSALRDALGNDRDLIQTVAGRGYQFTGEIRFGPASPSVAVAEPQSSSMTERRAQPATNLHKPVADLIARHRELAEVTSLVSQHRLLTLAGPGGIGKTRLALDLAWDLLAKFAGGVWFIDLAPLTDSGLVASTVGVTLNLQLDTGTTSPEKVAAALQNRELLIVLDNCEHVIEAAAGMAEALLRTNSLARVLATSREPLKAEGEYVYRVGGLEVPSLDDVEVDDVLRHGAVKLFVNRMHGTAPYGPIDVQTGRRIAEICRRLDGIPLAIELAAARASSLGVETLRALLDDRFHLLVDGRRTALPRYRTLRAMVDWSYEAISNKERMVFWRIAVFSGGFTLEDAGAIAAGGGISQAEVAYHMANLVDKSLLTADITRIPAEYRLLETMRAYALEKLRGSGERDEVIRRQAETYRDRFDQAETDWSTESRAKLLETYERDVENARTALDWAFSPTGYASLGVALTIAAAPLRIIFSRMGECHSWVERALASIASGQGGQGKQEMQLRAIFALLQLLTKAGNPEPLAAWSKALELAETVGDAEYVAVSLWGVWHSHLSAGNYRTALRLAERLRNDAVDNADPNVRVYAERMIGMTLHFMGEQANAWHHLEHMRNRNVAPASAPIIRFQINWFLKVRHFPYLLWVVGLADQAQAVAESDVVGATKDGIAGWTCWRLGVAAVPSVFSPATLRQQNTISGCCSTIRKSMRSRYGGTGAADCRGGWRSGVARSPPQYSFFASPSGEPVAILFTIRITRHLPAIWRKPLALPTRKSKDWR